MHIMFFIKTPLRIEKTLINIEEERDGGKGGEKYLI